MLLHTTFRSPLFDRSSKDLQSVDPSVLQPSSTTTDHHRTSGPISAADNVWVPNRSWYRAARLQGPGLSSIPGYRQKLRRDLAGLRRCFLLHFSSPGCSFVRRGSHLGSARLGSARWSFPPGSVRAARPPNNFSSFSFVGSRSGGGSPGSPPAPEALKPNFHSVESNFSRRRRETRVSRKPDRGIRSDPGPPSPTVDGFRRQQKGPAGVGVLPPPHGPSEKFSSPAEESLLSRSCPGIRRSQAGRCSHHIRSAFQNKTTNWRLDVMIVF